MLNEERLGLYTVSPRATLSEAMAVIERNHARCAIVVDGEQATVVGALSDGDVRRALLARRLLSTPVEKVMNLNPIMVRPGGEQEAPHLAREHRVSLIPVVGDNQEILDILDDLV